MLCLWPAHSVQVPCVARTHAACMYDANRRCLLIVSCMWWWCHANARPDLEDRSNSPLLQELEEQERLHLARTRQVRRPGGL